MSRSSNLLSAPTESWIKPAVREEGAEPLEEVVVASLGSLFRLAQLSDSAFPVGGFSFSSGLEAAVAEGVVRDALTLGDYVRAVVRLAGECDCVAMLHAYRAAAEGYLDQLVVSDRRVLDFKTSSEARAMTLKMGRRLTELLHSTATPPVSHLVEQWHRWVHSGHTFGTYPIAYAVAALVWGISEEELFVGYLYGVGSSVLGAALRLMRITHVETQQIALRLAPLVEELYAHNRHHTLEDMRAFAPMLDVVASLHEKGTRRMFMN